MANEAVLVTRLENPIQFTVANGTGIEKGTVCKMADPMTASASSAANDIIAGIAASEKIALDGVTTLAIYRRGIFRMKLSGGCTVGDALASASLSPWLNYVYQATAACSGSRIIGHALETGTDSETILVDLNIGTGAAI